MIALGALLPLVYPGWLSLALMTTGFGRMLVTVAIWTLALEMGYMFGRPAVFLGVVLTSILSALAVRSYIGENLAMAALVPLAAFCLVPFISRRHRASLEKISADQAVETALETVILDEYADSLLTPKERDIYRYMCLGYKNREIADRAGITGNTLKGHARNIYKKFGVGNKKELLSRLSRENVQ